MKQKVIEAKTVLTNTTDYYVNQIKRKNKHRKIN